MSGSPALIILYDTDAMEVRCTDGSRLELSPCGATMIYQPPLRKGDHPRQSVSSRIHKRTCFVTSEHKKLVVQTLDFRNRFANRPYLCEELINKGDVLTLYASVDSVKWPDSDDSINVEILADGSRKITSLDDFATLVVSPHGQDFSVSYLSRISHDDKGKDNSSSSNARQYLQSSNPSYFLSSRNRTGELSSIASSSVSEGQGHRKNLSVPEKMNEAIVQPFHQVSLEDGENCVNTSITNNIKSHDPSSRENNANAAAVQVLNSPHDKIVNSQIKNNGGVIREEEIVGDRNKFPSPNSYHHDQDQTLTEEDTLVFEDGQNHFNDHHNEMGGVEVKNCSNENIFNEGPDQPFVRVHADNNIYNYPASSLPHPHPNSNKEESQIVPSSPLTHHDISSISRSSTPDGLRTTIDSDTTLIHDQSCGGEAGSNPILPVSTGQRTEASTHHHHHRHRHSSPNHCSSPYNNTDDDEIPRLSFVNPNSNSQSAAKRIIVTPSNDGSYIDDAEEYRRRHSPIGHDGGNNNIHIDSNARRTEPGNEAARLCFEESMERDNNYQYLKQKNKNTPTSHQRMLEIENKSDYDNSIRGYAHDKIKSEAASSVGDFIPLSPTTARVPEDHRCSNQAMAGTSEQHSVVDAPLDHPSCPHNSSHFDVHVGDGDREGDLCTLCPQSSNPGVAQKSYINNNNNNNNNNNTTGGTVAQHHIGTQQERLPYSKSCQSSLSSQQHTTGSFPVSSVIQIESSDNDDAHTASCASSSAPKEEESACRKKYVWVTTHASRNSCPREWTHPLMLALNAGGEGMTAGGTNKPFRQQKTSKAKDRCKQSVIPQPLPLTCPFQHKHRMMNTNPSGTGGSHRTRSGDGGGSVGIDGDVDHGSTTSSIGEFQQGRLKVVVSEGIIYRLTCCKEMTLVEVYPGDGTVLVSQGVKAIFFTHYIPRTDVLEERTYSLKSLPPGCAKGRHSIEKMMKTANRFVHICLNWDKRAGNAKPPCWQKEMVAVVAPLSSSLLEECCVRGLGRFSAYTNGRVRVLFEDRTALDTVADFTPRLGNLVEMNQNALYRNECGARTARLLVPSGNYITVEVNKPGPYAKYLSAAKEWIAWVNASQEERQEFYKRQNQPLVMLQAADMELKKIFCFNYILEHTAGLSTTTSQEQQERDLEKTKASSFPTPPTPTTTSIIISSSNNNNKRSAVIDNNSNNKQSSTSGFVVDASIPTNSAAAWELCNENSSSATPPAIPPHSRNHHHHHHRHPTTTSSSSSSTSHQQEKYYHYYHTSTPRYNYNNTASSLPLPPPTSSSSSAATATTALRPYQCASSSQSPTIGAIHVSSIHPSPGHLHQHPPLLVHQPSHHHTSVPSPPPLYHRQHTFSSTSTPPSLLPHVSLNSHHVLSSTPHHQNKLVETNMGFQLDESRVLPHQDKCVETSMGFQSVRSALARTSSLIHDIDMFLEDAKSS